MANDTYKMQPDEFKSLREQANEVTLRDVHVGRLLQNIVHHLGHAHGLDAAEEDKKAEKQAEQPKASAKKEG